MIRLLLRLFSPDALRGNLDEEMIKVICTLKRAKMQFTHSFADSSLLQYLNEFMITLAVISSTSVM